MKISQKGLYALQAMMMLARHYHQGAIRIRDIAYEEGLPEKFLELILLELKNARMVESVRGAKGGYQLRRPPSEIRLSEIIRLIDGALAPFGDAEQLRGADRSRCRSPRVVSGVSASAGCRRQNSGKHHPGRHRRWPGRSCWNKKRQRKKDQEAELLPMVVHGNQGEMMNRQVFTGIVFHLYSARSGFSQTVIRVGAFPNITHPQAMVGKANGYFEKAMGSHGEDRLEEFQRRPVGDRGPVRRRD